MRIPTDWLYRALRRITVNRRPPDFVIGTGEEYLRRWWVIPRNRFFNIYFHQVLRSDDDRALHDHPWINLSVILSGRYREVVTARPAVVRKQGSVVLRLPSTQHRLELIDNKPCWTLFITGPRLRVWGFQCPQGWIPWEQFVDPTNAGRRGPGCGD